MDIVEEVRKVVTLTTALQKIIDLLREENQNLNERNDRLMKDNEFLSKEWHEMVAELATVKAEMGLEINMLKDKLYPEDT
jgi:predicted RNase H-like nuclease (RuvC/YqgF family)